MSSKSHESHNPLPEINAISDNNTDIWIAFTGCRGMEQPSSLFVFEIDTRTRKEFSRVVRTSSSGQFFSSINCKLRRKKPHSFTLYSVEPEQDPSSVLHTYPKLTVGRHLLLHFALDLEFISKQLNDSSENEISQTLASPGTLTVTFRASHFEFKDDHEGAETTNLEKVEYGDVPLEDWVLLDGFDRAKFTNSLRSIENAVHENLRMMEEDGYEEEDEERHLNKHRVRFDPNIREIPTTDQLQQDIYQALCDRTKLWGRVEELSVQLLRTKLELRNVKESLRNLSQHDYAERKGHAASPDIVDRKSRKKPLRVIIDGHSVATTFGGPQGWCFKVEGIDIAISHYVKRHINVLAIISEGKIRRVVGGNETEDLADNVERLKQLFEGGFIALSPTASARKGFMLKYAVEEKASIVSNDCFHTEMSTPIADCERRKLKSFVQHHQISFAFIDGKFFPHTLTAGFASGDHPFLHTRRSMTL